jgi:hypothetical protein
VPPDLASLGLDDARRGAVDRLILEDRRVIALKVMMDASGCSLAHAMDVLASRTEELRQSRPQDFAGDDAPPRRFSS